MDRYYPWASHFITWDELGGLGGAVTQREMSRYKNRLTEGLVPERLLFSRLASTSFCRRADAEKVARRRAQWPRAEAACNAVH